MKIVRYSVCGKTEYGIENDGVISKIEGDIFSEFKVTEEKTDIADVKLLTPCIPSKIIAVGLNYKDHAKEMKEELPNEPLLFMKPPTAAVESGGYIGRPHGVNELSYEAELAIVIKKEAKNIKADDAFDYILGYTCLNDVTSREHQRKDGQWIRAKGFDTFAPLGPCIETELNPDNCDITLTLNGEIRQKSNTKNFIFKTAELVSFISGVMTLMPGDVITTGTPSGIGLMADGDTVCVEIENIGKLINQVKG